MMSEEVNKNSLAFLCQKRPITVSNETYYSVKRDLLQSEEVNKNSLAFLLPVTLSEKSVP